MTTNNLNNECLNDFVVGEGASGSTRKLRVENDNNTASSQAYLENYVAGTSADDPYTSCIVGTTVSHAIGVDNSDSQSLKLGYAASASATPSSTEFLKTDTDSHNFYDKQPCFYAYVGTSIDNVTGDNTNYDCIFDTERFDVGSNYNTGTGLFTAPIAGRYLFTINPWFNNIVASNSSMAYYFEVNGSARVSTLLRGYDLAYAGIEFQYPITKIFNLASSDTVGLVATWYSGTKTVQLKEGERSFFAGYLIG